MFKIIVLDNGAFHKAKALRVPEDIGLIFLPPYCPELNPAENILAILKRKFTNRLHNTLDELSDFITEAYGSLTEESVKRTCAFNYIFLKLKLDYLINIIGVKYVEFDPTVWPT